MTKRSDGKRFHFDNMYSENPLKCGGIDLHQLGELSCEAGFEVEPHHQWCYEISYIISGKGVFLFNDIPVVVMEGDLVISPLGKCHTIKASENQPLHYAYLGFNFNKDAVTSEYKYLKNFFNNVEKYKVNDGTPVMFNFFKSIGEFYQNSECRYLMINTYVHQILVLAYRAFTSDSPNKIITDNASKSVGQAVYAAIRYMDKNILLPIDIKKMSSEIGYSNTYLSYIFKKKMGITLQQYISEKKIENAKELLKYGKLSISQVAARLNYSGLQAFSRAFKRVAGLSPTQFLTQFHSTQKANNVSQER